jgi:hypothetical protein
MREIALAAAIVALTAPTGFAQELTVTVVGDECARATRHGPDSDVAYVPNIGIDGESVAPADVAGAPQVRVPDSFVVPITVDLARRFGIPATPDLYKAEPHIGTVVFRDGEAWFNGQRLSGGDELALIAACREASRNAR